MNDTRRSARDSRSRCRPLVAWAGIGSALAFAAPTSLSAQAVADVETKSGYSQAPTLEGGDGVSSDLAEDDVATGGWLETKPIRKAFEPWFKFKRWLNERHGLKLNVTYQTLYQSADQTLTDVDQGAAGRAQIQGQWTFLGRGTKNPSNLTFRIENRHLLGQEIPPSQLSSQFGSITNTGTGFSDFGTVLSELAWRQTLLDGDLKLITGKISALSWYNTHALSSSMRGFQNTGLQSSLSKPAPGRGIGAGFGVHFSPHWVMVAGGHDANAKTTEDPFNTIGEREFYYSTELRYYPTTPDRWRWDSVKLQLWYQDERKEAAIPQSSGVTFQASRLFDDRWFPFLLGGVSDGEASLLKRDLIVGLGVAINTPKRVARDALGIAVGWGRPALDELRDQWTAELFYRLQLLQALAITPSVQLISRPAANPTDDQVVVVGLRARLQF